MPKYLMKPLTSNSWILYQDGERFGLVSNLKDKISIVGNLSRKEYENLDDLKKALGNLHIDTTIKIKSESINNNINGYPIKHPTYFNPLEDPIPSYTKTENSQLRYAAGYYALKFSYAWTPSFCPKLETLTEYEYIGPYKTKLEMQHQISTKNKEITL